MTPTYRRPRLESCCARWNWAETEGNQVVFGDKFRFSLSSDYNRVRVWRSRDERLNPLPSLYSDAPLPQMGLWISSYATDCRGRLKTVFE
ncbi:hypothetical protein TNCV_2995951 [Trichonephila clavipes]|nr:hypothetical protein TNCV_2995951 [Trichonephila clavipes]